MYWTFSLVLKVGFSMLPELNPSTIDWSGKDDAEAQSTTSPVLFSILNFALGLVCDVVPYLIIVDSQFIKILTFDAHRQYELEQKEQKEQESTAQLQGQDEHLHKIRSTSVPLRSSLLRSSFAHLGEPNVAVEPFTE